MQPGNTHFAIKTLDFDHFREENIEKRVCFQKSIGKFWEILCFSGAILGLKSPWERSPRRLDT